MNRIEKKLILITLTAILTPSYSAFAGPAGSPNNEINQNSDSVTNYEALRSAFDLSGLYDVRRTGSDSIDQIEVGFKTRMELNRQRHINGEHEAPVDSIDTILANPENFYFSVSGLSNNASHSVDELIRSTKNFFSTDNLIDDANDFLNYTEPSFSYNRSTESIPEWRRRWRLTNPDSEIVKTHFSYQALEDGSIEVTLGTMFTRYREKELLFRDNLIRPVLEKRFFVRINISSNGEATFRSFFRDRGIESTFLGNDGVDLVDIATEESFFQTQSKSFSGSSPSCPAILK